MSFSDIELWCFSFVTLFNLQGTRRRLGGGTFFILPHFFELVKYFFQLFSKFFQYFARSAFRFRKLCYFITSAFFCQVLFSTFSKFFRRSTRFQPLPLESLIILPHLLPFVKCFFQILLNLFPSALQNPAPLSDSSLTIPNPSPFVNTFREKNWKFLEICRFLSVPAGLRAHFTWFFAGIGIYTADFSYILLL